MILWTVIAGLALWWLLRTSAQIGATPTWGIPGGDTAQQSFAERVRGWFMLAHLNFQRVYPWILLSPYAAWLAVHFSGERRRLWVNLPVHLVAGVAFVIASQAINARTNMTIARVVVINSQHSTDPATTNREPEGVRVEVSKAGTSDVFVEQRSESLAIHGPSYPPLPNGLAHAGHNGSKAGFADLLIQMGQSSNPSLPPLGMPTLRPLSTLLDLLAYGAVVGMAQSVHFYRRYRERERRALSLESNLANARLNALRAQLQPHFLFNSLNAIATLLRRDPRLAEATLMSLSDLLRLTLNQSDRQEVKLLEEMEFVHRYLEIQQTRFGDRLRVEEEIEPAALDCLVPTLLLQPLVENAIRHGIEPAEDAGLVRLIARQQDGTLIIAVEDDGVGLPDAASDQSTTPKPNLRVNSDSLSASTLASFPAVDSRGGTGIGLTNLRARLETLYGSNQKLDLLPRSGGGVTVLIQIPLRREHPETTGAGDES